MVGRVSTGAQEQAPRRLRPGAVPVASVASVPSVPPVPPVRPAEAWPVPPAVADRLGHRVTDLVADLVGDLGRTVPGAVAGVYVVGSAALGDHAPDLDDVDLVVVLRAGPDALLGRLLDDVHQRVERAHRATRPDLVYTTWADLVRDGTAPAAPASAAAAAAPTGAGLPLARRDGRTDTGPTAAPTALTRHQLLDHGLAVLGPPLSAREVAVDRQQLSAYCLAEITGHWTPWWERSALLLSSAGRESLTPRVTEAVLGVTRLHHTLLTGRLTGLTAAGEWALTVCEPEWSRLLQEALRVRRDPGTPSLYRDPLRRRREALAFTDLLMTADEEAFGPAPDQGEGQPDGRR